LRDARFAAELTLDALDKSQTPNGIVLLKKWIVAAIPFQRLERSAAIQRLEQLELLDLPSALMSDMPNTTREKTTVCSRHRFSLANAFRQKIELLSALTVAFMSAHVVKSRSCRGPTGKVAPTGWVNYFHVHNSTPVFTRQRFFLE
jgi:hypothetical protein